jgi:hypothetical protein
MRDGCGDDFFALFNEAGCFLKGFAHEAEMSPYRLRPRQLWPGMLDTVPREFAACLEEPAFSIEDTTFCIWRRYADKRWRRADLEFSKGEDPDGSRSLLSILDGCPKTYAAWARDYYEQPVRISDVQFVYAHKPLTRTLVRSLNPNIEFEDLKTDIKEIGYPDDINN